MRQFIAGFIFFILSASLCGVAATVCMTRSSQLVGDVNCDGEVNIHDVNDLIEILLGHHVVGTHVESADVNNDGQINISDVNTLIDILLNPPVNYTVTLDCDLAEMNVGDTIKLTATIQHAAYLDPSFTWSSTDEAVAVVHDGTVIALAAGECDIIAEFKGNHAACHVVVSEVFPEQVTLSQASATLEVSKQLMLTATVYPSNVSDPTLTWSTSDEAVATVSGTGESGTVTAIVMQRIRSIPSSSSTSSSVIRPASMSAL